MTKPITVKNLVLGEGLPKVCVPLVGTSKEEIQEEARAAALAGADLVEWRADFFDGLNVTEALSETLSSLSDILGQIPLLFTIRTANEGGNREICTDDYVNLNLQAARTGKADFIDVEVFGEKEKKQFLIEEIHKTNAKVIASTHDFLKTGSREELLGRFEEMDQTGADILKIAARPVAFDDTAAVMQVTKAMTEKTEKPLIGISMGETGAITRIAGENFGSCITFATVGGASAPGQFPIRDLRIMMDALHAKNIK